MIILPSSCLEHSVGKDGGAKSDGPHVIGRHWTSCNPDSAVLHDHPNVNKVASRK